MKYQLYIYDLPPLDWTFCFFTVAELKERIRKQADHIYWSYQTGKSAEDICNDIDCLLQEAEEAASNSHWDGEYRDEPLIFAIPAGEEINVIEGKYCPLGSALFGIIIKQDNDGVTYVYSPIQLKHLEYNG